VDEVKKIAKLAKAIFLRDGFHIPVLFIKGTEGRIAIGLQKFGDTSDERVQVMLKVGTWAACKASVGELELVILVNESWMGTNINVLPSNDPNRIEVLQIASLDTRTMEEGINAFKINRNPKGTVTDLEELSFPDTMETKGRLLPAFLKGYLAVSPVKN